MILICAPVVDIVNRPWPIIQVDRRGAIIHTAINRRATSLIVEIIRSRRRIIKLWIGVGKVIRLGATRSVVIDGTDGGEIVLNRTASYGTAAVQLSHNGVGSVGGPWLVENVILDNQVRERVGGPSVPQNDVAATIRIGKGKGVIGYGNPFDPVHGHAIAASDIVNNVVSNGRSGARKVKAMEQIHNIGHIVGDIVDDIAVPNQARFSAVAEATLRVEP